MDPRIIKSESLRLIQTERLLLRPFTLDDLERTHALFDRHPDVWRFDGRYPRSLEQRRRLLLWRIAELEYGGIGALAVALRETGELIGQVGLQFWLCERTDGAMPEVELFYKFGRDYWGQGYATEAARALIFYAFTDLKLKRIVSTAARDNAHSVNLLRRVGMTISDDPTHPGDILGTLENTNH
ncbi:MAG: hypothetical protein OJF49_000750 [Ktedonobacterales bacterium]|jgi:RimJ/RimL family protein N-acetyltransferase|nr:MAG: hypothetical protein OJF49_000750 [Ktedonobacterales bacterium]